MTGRVYGSVRLCPDEKCGKQCFTSKSDAKRAARGFEGRQGRLNAYKCGDYWHLGHLPSVISRGRASR